MPNPKASREDFEAAAQRVIAKAPAGLSREQFLDAIDRELVHQQADKINATPLKEPTTKIGGWIKGLNDYATDLGNAAFEGAAHPKTAGDILSLLMPTTLPLVVKGLRSVPRDMPLESMPDPIGNRAIKFSARRAADVLDLTPNIVSSKLEDKAVGALRNFGESKPPTFNELPLAKQMDYLPSRGPVPERGTSVPPVKLGVTPTETPFHEMPLYRQMEDLPTTGPIPERKPNVPPVKVPVTRPTGPTPILRKDGAAPPSTSVTPSLEEELQKALNGGPDEGTELPPPVETAGEGPLKQSGKFGRSGSKGQAGGYSSGRPGVSGSQYDELMDQMRPSEPAAASSPIDELLHEFGGGESGTAAERPPSATEPPPSSKWPPEGGQGDWHSETESEPGSREAELGKSLHQSTSELDQRYRMLRDEYQMKKDPLAALLLSLGGAGAVGSMENR